MNRSFKGMQTNDIVKKYKTRTTKKFVYKIFNYTIKIYTTSHPEFLSLFKIVYPSNLTIINAWCVN